jgi:hypothetical protein
MDEFLKPIDFAGLIVIENRVLRGTFGPKGDAVTGGWKGLLNEELYNLYSSTSIIKNQGALDAQGT